MNQANGREDNFYESKMSDNVPPLFVAQQALCYYPISTIYDSCPRYLFYALLLASCMTRWTGWLVDVFLGAAATYAGTAAFESFILVASPAKRPVSGIVNIPYISTNNLSNETRLLLENFPLLVTDLDQVVVEPASLELDADAILAVVITGYLVFLPLQCWSRVLSHNYRARTILFCLWNCLMLAGSICALVYWPTLRRAPIQYMFCFPNLPPLDDTSSDGWQSSWRQTASWNESVWSIFSDERRFEQLGDLCFNPCFNTSQILRQQTTLHATTADIETSTDFRRNKFFYSTQYIYALIALCVILNCLLLLLKILPYQSGIIRSAQPIAIWKERRTILHSLKMDYAAAVAASKPSPPPPPQSLTRTPAPANTNHDTLAKRMQPTKDDEANQNNTNTRPSEPAKIWKYIHPLLRRRFFQSWFRFLAGVAILIGLIFSIIVSPFTVIAFVVWIEWYIYHDGPFQENPQQVGQWSYCLSIGLLVISAGILKLRYKVASRKEIDSEIDHARKQLDMLLMIREEKNE